MKQSAVPQQKPSVAFSSPPSSQPQNVGKPVAQVMQPSFPQGSILVVPHPQHPFHTVLPVFAAGPSVVVTQGASPHMVAMEAHMAVAVTQHGADQHGTVSTTSVIQSSAAGAGRKEDGEKGRRKEGGKEGEKESSSKEKEGGVDRASDKEGRPDGKGEKKAAELVQALPKGSDGIRERLIFTTAATSSRTPPSSSAGLQHPMTTPTAVAAIMTPEGRPVLIPAHAAAAMAGAQPFVFPQGLPTMPVFTVKLPEPVPLSMVDFESKSIEITGEVPIRKVDVQEEQGAVADGGRLIQDTKEQEKEAEKDRKEIEEGKEEGGGKRDQKREAARPKTKEEGGVIKETLRGHTSQEVMSAKMLLSLTGRPGLSSPLDKDAPSAVFAAQSITQELNRAVARSEHQISKEPTTAAASPLSGSAPQTPSGVRKRKQKPTPSAKASEASGTPETVGEKATPAEGSARGKRVRREKKVDDNATEDGDQGKEPEEAKTPKRSKKQVAKQEPQKPREFTAQELLAILEIPPATDGEMAATPVKPKPQKSTPKSGRGKKGGAAKAKNAEAESEIPASKAMQQLKAERESRPLKEYIIETDTESGDDSDSSSSGTSSGFSPDSGSSSDSSSDSSSESAASESKVPQKAPVRGRGGRGRGGRGRGRGRGGSHARKGSSSDESSSGEEDATAEEHGRGRGRRRGGTRGRGRGPRGGGGGRAQGHIVRIPTKILSHKPSSGRKRKSTGSHEVCQLFPLVVICFISIFPSFHSLKWTRKKQRVEQLPLGQSFSQTHRWT